MNLTNEFNDTTYNQYLIDKAARMKFPIVNSFELTPICNMRCRMCYIQQEGQKVRCKGGVKTIDFWENLIDQFVDEGMLFCLLTGGEVFTYPHFKELYSKLKKKGIHIAINTNATLIDETVIEWLSKDPPRRLNISLYGACRETYENLCHYGDGFDKVIHAFELLRQHNIDFRIHGVLVPSNINDYEGIKAIANRFKAPLMLSYYMFPPFRKDEEDFHAPERFEPEEMAQVAFRYRKDQYAGSEEKWIQYIEKTKDIMDHPEKNPIYGYPVITCHAGSNTCWVNWKGEVAGCGMGGGKLHDLTVESVHDAWKEIVSETNTTGTSKECAYCKYRIICPVCSAAAFCETGDIAATPEYLCEFSHSFATLLLQEYERIHLNDI